MRAWLAMVVFAALSGCDFKVQKCTTTADCTKPGVCSGGICVLPDDGGTGGGATGGGGSTGGGGGSTGGGTGGGVTGGGTGGGPTCPSTCPTGYSCGAGESECFRRLTGVVIDAPAEGFLTNQTTVTVQAHLTMDASVSTPDALQLTVDNGAPQNLNVTATPNYQATLTSLAPGSHTVRVVAQLADGGLSAGPISFTIDATAPNLTGAVPTSTLQRDDLRVLVLSTNEALRAGSVQVRLGDAFMAADDGGTCAGSAGCWVLDMSAPTLAAMEGDFAVTVSATDLAGNTSPPVALGQPFHVTRKRWEVLLPATEIRAAPATGTDGTLFVGTRTNATTGTLYALNPLDGGVLNSTTTLGGIVSVATGTSGANELVYFTSNDTLGGAVGSRHTSLDAGTLNAVARGNSGTPTFSALALVEKSASETGAVAAFNNVMSQAGSTVVYSSVSMQSGVNASPLTAFDFAVVPDQVTTPNNIIVSGSTAYLLTRPAGVGLYRRSVTAVNATPVDGSPVTIAASGTVNLTGGQSFVGSESLIGGLGGLQSYYRVGATLNAGNLGVDVDNGMAASDGTLAYAGRGSDLVAFNPFMLTATPTILGTVSGNVRASPVLGQARTNGTALGYAVTSTASRLYVFPVAATAGAAVDYGAIFSGGNGTVYGHPTLDCNRRVGAAKASTGVLYVTNSEGRVAALIVDSPKLLTTAGAWPKYQRTAGNAGNPNDTRFPLNPNCPP